MPEPNQTPTANSWLPEVPGFLGFAWDSIVSGDIVRNVATGTISPSQFKKYAGDDLAGFKTITGLNPDDNPYFGALPGLPGVPGWVNVALLLAGAAFTVAMIFKIAGEL
jgi:hypothetical protein